MCWHLSWWTLGSSLCISKEKRKCGNLEYVFPQFYVSSSLWIAPLQQLIIVCSHLRFSIQTTVFCPFAPFYHLVLIIPCFLVIFFWLWFSFFRDISHYHRGPVVVNKTTFFVLNDSQKFPSHNLDTDKRTSSMHHKFRNPSFLLHQPGPQHRRNFVHRFLVIRREDTWSGFTAVVLSRYDTCGWLKLQQKPTPICHTHFPWTYNTFLFIELDKVDVLTTLEWLLLSSSCLSKKELIFKRQMLVVYFNSAITRRGFVGTTINSTLLFDTALGP